MTCRMRLTPFAVALWMCWLGLVNPDALSGAEPEIRAAARQVDLLVEQGLRAQKAQPNPRISDEQFVRRVYLDVIGRVPTLDEARRFLDSADRDKRAKLIDQLLDSPGYVSNFYNYYADILRIQTRLNNNVPGQPYIDWLKDSLRQNKHWDVMVRELLTAEGYIWDNGAAGYYLRDVGMPLDNLSNTVRIFLGTQLGCAQCHDHPFDKWSQLEFYEMAAFTYGVQTRSRGGNVNLRELRREARSMDPSEQRVLRRLVRPLSFKVEEKSYKQLRLPDDYKYDDAKPKQKVEPATVFGETVSMSKDDSRTQVFAAWVTSKKNPRFAMTIANRLWARLMGVGIINPVDDIRDDSENVNPVLLEYLTARMIAGDFDLKQYLRLVLNTQTYQRQASRLELRPDQLYYFPGPALRRMTAEQVWDSLLTMVVDEVDTRTGRPDFRLALAPKLAQMNGDELIALAKNPQKLRQMTREEAGPMMMQAMQMRRKGGSRGSDKYLRASELPSPAPPGHFLREFGQSDREQIEASTTEPTLTQALQLLNGQIDQQLIKKTSVLYRHVDAAAGDDAKIDTLWLSILSREPSSNERRLAEREIADHGRDGYANLVWALLNTREFLFIQ